MLTVMIALGASLQTAIETHPDGTVFQLATGTYRGEQFKAKNNDEFVGDPAGGTVLSGAIVLNQWIACGRYWVASGLPGPLNGKTINGSNPMASNLNDLFINDMLYKRVASLSQVTAGTWFFVPTTNSAYVSDDPTGKLVEYSLKANLTYDNGAIGVLIKDVTIDKYATDAQTAPIHGVRGWRIINVTSTQNHGAGLNIGAGTIVQGGHYINNGQIGINGWHADDTKVLGAEIAGNNYAGYNTEWEAGGMKLAGSSNVVVSGNNVHDNHGQGLWSDIDDRNFLYSNNTVANNGGVGIMYEISHGSTVIRDNTIICNDGPGIYISNSNGVTIRNNAITVKPTNVPGINGSAGGGGIDVINATRGSGPDGLYQSTSNNIHNNVIIHPGDAAQDGVFIYQAIASADNPANAFDFNTYYVQDATTRYWHFGKRSYDWRALTDDTGFERHGAIVIIPDRKLDSCSVTESDLSTGE